MKNFIAGISITFGMLIPLLASSQKTFISLGAEIAFPVTNYSEMGNSGIGGSVTMERPWSKHVSRLISVEYVQYATREINEYFHEQFSALPIQFGEILYNRKNSLPGGFLSLGGNGLYGGILSYVYRLDQQ
jgi:hypothetical protein